MFIRQIAESDFPAWFAMRKALWPYHTDQELTDDQMTLFSDPDQAFFLAWEESADDQPAQVIGMIEMAIRPHAPGSENAPVPYVEGWYVAPSHRGKGLGRALIETGAAWGRDKGYSRVASDTIPLTYPTSPAAHAACGFRIVAEYPAGVVEDEPSMHFIKDLTP